jgi:sucrose-phosphate synthase
MKIAFLNPQGNFDARDSYWTEHADFGGQLVYVKEVAIAMAARGHQVDILTRQIVDPDWPEFEASQERYPGVDNVRIVRLPCGPRHFLPKEELWPHLGTEWVPNIVGFYRQDDGFPDAFTAHYADGALSAALLKQEIGLPFTMTGHSLGAQKMDKLGVTPESLAGRYAHFHFPRRIFAERVGMNHAGRIITSTTQERLEQYGHPAYRGAVDPQDDNRFAVVPPGVNLRVFSPLPSPADATIRQRIHAALARDIDEARRELPLVIASSRLDEKKNHMGLVRAFAASADLRAAANLAIVVRGLADPLHQYHPLSPGEKAIMERITAVMNQNELWGTVTAFPLNSQRELAAAYRVLARRGSAFALTALHEPFGLAPLEAMSCGLPAVVTRNGGPSESIVEGDREFGVLVDPTDLADIAHGLLRLVGPDNEWQTFHQAGRQRVLDRYTWERTSEGYLRVIAEMLVKQPALDQDEELPVPAYFFAPRPELDLTVDLLLDIWPIAPQTARGKQP